MVLPPRKPADTLPPQKTSSVRFGQRMRDSIKLWCRCGPARSEQGSTGALHLDRFESLTSAIKNTQPRKWLGVFWQRMRDSNPRKRSQSPVCYRYTNPLNATTLLYAILFKSQALFAKFVILFLFFRRFPREGLPLQDTFPQVGKGLVLTFIPQHGQKIGQLLQGFRMQQVLLKAAVEVV